MTNNDVRQLAQVNRWLELAPRPRPVENGKTWHVFLSYRSVNRNWVLHLYDALRLVGFNVFLDQLEIAVGDSLVRRLDNALQSSHAGIIVWSTRYEDSEWCLTEYETMQTLRNDKAAKFRFVVAKLNDVELPPMVRKDVYVDFSDYPNGPQGGELLRLMYGLLGQPLPEPVLRAAQEIDEQSKEALSRIAAAKAISNVQSLVGLSKEGGEVWQSSPLLYCAAAEALIELGANDRALEVLALAAQFERAIRPIQLTALAFARKAKLASTRAKNAATEPERTAASAEADALLVEAQQSLARLEALGHRDPETLGIYARTWMDRHQITGSRIFLEKSRDLYARAFTLNDDDYYTGINAASKSVMLGELETGAAFASKVESLVGSAAVPKDYWKTATVGETLLLQKKFDEAAAIYRKGVAEFPLAVANHASTRAQAELLLKALGAPPAASEKVLAAFVV
jgi:hypothetical protein